MSLLDGDVCLSGGAEGADLQWGMTAGCAGHRVIHWSFPGHRSRAPDAEVVRLSDEQLAKADEQLAHAAVALGRRYPPRSPFVRRLLQRNFYQVAWSEAVYAVAGLERGLVTGGTGWAVQMFLDLHHGKDCPAFVFCQASKGWHQWCGEPAGWQPIAAPPVPTGIWAGIGSRDLTDDGKQAIRGLMQWSSVAPGEATSPLRTT